jgi:hypothetical protein
MMKNNTIIFILFCFNLYSCARTQTVQVVDMKIKEKVLKMYRKYDIETIEECERGLQKAMKDYYNGVFQIYDWGDSACSEDSTCVRFKRILKLEYGISSDNLGCTPVDIDKCYSEWMERKIKLKYGKDFFDKIWKRAALLAKKH